MVTHEDRSLGYPVSRETLDKLELYEQMLSRWQRVKNLVGPSTLAALWTRHFADSIQLLEILPSARHWVDLGSGAGFPGMVIAIALSATEGSHVSLIESDHRKCAFLREVARETGAPVTVINERIEIAAKKLGSVDVVTARALAALPLLLQYATPMLREGAIGLFLKGQDVASELTKDPIFGMFELAFIPSRTSPDARIVKAVWRRNDGPADSSPEK